MTGHDDSADAVPALRTIPLDELEPARAEVHRAIATGPRNAFFRSIGVADPDAGLPGPFNAMVRAPAVGGVLHRVGEAIRYAGVLPPLVRELAILRVATTRDSAFEWRSHEDEARRQGADDVMLATVREGGFTGDDDVDLALAVTDALLRQERVDDALLARLMGRYDEEGAVELVVLVGYYDLLADLMRTFRVE